MRWQATAIFTLLLAVVACGDKGQSKRVTSEPGMLPSEAGLRSPGEFAHIEDQQQRSVALFDEIGKVILHPRCINCHPNGDRPLQGVGLPHQPLVVRGKDDQGAPGLPCASCHGSENYLNVPGTPNWHLAPLEMAWVGKSLGTICQQIKDPARNGGKSMAQIQEHMAHDELVGYGWNPPEHLEKAPGSQALLGELVSAWIDSGSHCPAP